MNSSQANEDKDFFPVDLIEISKNLAKEKNCQLAATTALWATKPSLNINDQDIPLFLQKRTEIYLLY